VAHAHSEKVPSQPISGAKASPGKLIPVARDPEHRHCVCDEFFRPQAIPRRSAEFAFSLLV
jgi:hypothetical protein